MNAIQLIPYVVMIPLGAAFLITVIGKKARGLDKALSSISSASLLAISAWVAIVVTKAGILVYKTGWAPPGGISLVVDGLSAFMLVTVNIAALMIIIYSVDYIRKYTDEWKFYCLFMVMLAGINGVLIAGDIFNLYVFLEIAAIAAYCLVAFGTGADELEASFKYAIMGSVASVFILLGIAFLYSMTSTLNMADIAKVLSDRGDANALRFVAVMFLGGFALKGAFVPFHAWLPYAHSAAPAPVSAMLSGVLIKVLGIYAMVRVLFNVIGIDPVLSGILIALAVASMLLASIMAFGQTDIKRLFAYSSISQVGYIALGLGVGTPLAILGALFHLFNHSLFKSLLFLNSGSIEEMYGTRELGRIRGASERSPVVGYTTLVGSLSICGIPPLGGFWSKLIIILACLQAGRPALAGFAALISLLTLAYYFKALSPALFGTFAGDADRSMRHRIRASAAIPMIVLATLSVLSVAMLIPGTANTLIRSASSVLTEGSSYAVMVAEALR